MPQKQKAKSSEVRALVKQASDKVARCTGKMNVAIARGKINLKDLSSIADEMVEAARLTEKASKLMVKK